MLSIGAAAGIGFVVILFSPLADVERVDIVGLHRLTLDEVETSLNFGPGVALVSLDFDAATAALEELRWFADATFESELNGVVTVRVFEQRPLAQTQDAGGGFVVVSHEGRILTEPQNTQLSTQLNSQLNTRPNSPAVLPLVLGRDPAPDLAPGDFLASEFEPLLAVADALGLSQVAVDRLWRDARNDIWLLLASQDRVALGDESQLAAKLAALMTLLDELDRHPASPPTGSASPPTDGASPPANGASPPADGALPPTENTPQFGNVLEIDVSVPRLPVVREAPAA